VAGWLPPEWAKAILPIAVQEDANAYTPIGTSFLLAFGGFNCLVTAKHVVLRDGQPRTGLFILNNLRNGNIIAKSFDVFAREGVQWIPHPEKEIAATICPMNPEIDDYRRFSETLFEEFANIREGDDIFFLGFPLGIVVPSKVTPIVRSGMVALKKNDDTYLIEANAFPGNSGSPVFFKPCPFELGPSGLTLGRIRPPKLIGIMVSSISYRDVAVSKQTGDERVIFEENSGLANVLSVSSIRETLNSPDFQNMLRRFRERLPPPSPSQT